MPLLPIKLPPGVYRNGTELDAAGRWYDANFVRWIDGVIHPIGGWARRTDTALTGKPRGIITWRDNSANRWIAVGTHSKLYSVTQSNAITDITPTGFTPGSADATTVGGYGVGYYGVEYYGSPREDVGTVVPATTWTLDTWGEYLVGCSNADGKIYEWPLSGLATVVTNAPTGNAGILVTNERSLVAFGAGGNPRLIQWSDLEDNTVWTPSSTNNAGSITLQTNGKIMAMKRVRGQNLILTDVDAHIMSYVGQPFIYNTEYVGRACGLAGPNAVAVQDNFAVWMSSQGFFTYDGYVKSLPCEVSDYVFSDINQDQISKVSAINNSQFHEVWWFYPSGSSTENDRYVVWDYGENHWTIGQIDRAVGTDRGAFRNPIFVGTDGYLYDHETGTNHGTSQVYLESGPIQIGNGDNVYYVNEMIPDERNQGDVTATFKSKYYPNASQATYGPYSMTNPTSVRFNGRQVQMRVDAVNNSDWRIGTMRLNAVAGGRR